MRALFLADKFSNEHRSAESRHPGGAELTDAAAFEACSYPLTCSTFRHLDPAQLDSHDLIVLGNSQSASPDQLAAIARTGRHVLFEHDLRICRLNGNFPAAIDPAHRLYERCWCPHEALRGVVRTARGMIFLTHRQLDHYHANPFFDFPPERTRVLGCSLFNRAFFDQLPTPRSEGQRRGSCLLYSTSFIKGTAEALAYIRARGWEPRLLKDMTPDAVLETFRSAERLVYLPIGLEPAGRMPVEARLNGCEVIVNDHVGVSGEAWFRRERADALAHLRAAPRQFWTFAAELFDAGDRRADPRQARSTERALAVLSHGVALLGTRQSPRLPLLGGAREKDQKRSVFAAW